MKRRFIDRLQNIAKLKGQLTERYCSKAAKERYDFIHEASNLNICDNLNPMIDETTQDVRLIILLRPIKI